MYCLFFHPPLLDLVEELLGPEIRLYPNYSVRPKMPDDEATLVLWHQDAGYTASGKHESDDSALDADMNALRMVNVWSPLVPARVENGCMQFVPRTHKLGLVPHHAKNRYYLEIEADTLQPRLPDAVSIEVDPGDIVIFSNLLFHCGLPNTSKDIRWSCDWRYQDATQSTARKEHGHIARSRSHPESAVKTAKEWASLSFG
jgi:ectoine hydroxylase-related dioxygenase (phytanoyl-CoA dioxygenase family)